VQRLQAWARELGFSQIAIAGIDLSTAEAGLLDWLAAGFHGSMAYMAAHGLKRARPAELVPGTVRVITARMDYLPRHMPGDAPPDWIAREWAALADPQRAVVSVYARGRDYHKVLRQRLQALADRLSAEVGPLGYRVFTDSAPVLEVELATRSGLGWRGKHTLMLSREAGSMAFLGEIYIDLPLPPSEPVTDHCGRCTACLDVCPTQAIVAPYRLDARRCISYLTIEHDGPIPLEFRRAMGNRIYGCDDCQLACPWNKYAGRSALPDFDERGAMGRAGLLALWAWDEAAFLRHTEGSAIRRIGHRRWQRNLAVALGNAWRSTGDGAYPRALLAQREQVDPLVQEHVDWALAQGPAVGGEGAAGVDGP
jgi:epoxyqueuosine reductase